MVATTFMDKEITFEERRKPKTLVKVEGNIVVIPG
jgi:hypothetical protein